MISVLSTNILSPLGVSTEQNYRAVKEGRSLLEVHQDERGVPGSFVASIFSDEQIDALNVEGFTRFESLVIRSVQDALSKTDIDPASDRLIFILSTTKADIEELAAVESEDKNYSSPGRAAGKVAEYFGFVNIPVVVCNACISGVSAQMTALRLMNQGLYDYAVVCGADCQSSFVISGFSSFKALSPEPCRPFDIDRMGLNIGEAAATIVFSAKTSEGAWRLIQGSLTNDAYHVSAPSPSGEGSILAIKEALCGVDVNSLSCVSVHGTATMFNDQMESMAIQATGLSEVPLSTLKGYYGHTMGAAGVLECILTMCAVDEGLLPACRGFEEIGVSGKVDIVGESRPVSGESFLKMISGFGGCNGALIYSKGEISEKPAYKGGSATVSHHIFMDSKSVVLDGESLEVKGTGKEMLSQIYKSYIGDYPKFHKMDALGKVVCMASELLLRKENAAPDASRAVILFNNSSSIVADRAHIACICDMENYYPSPSTFLYTLPNIAAGEIAIRHGYKAETSLYILDRKDQKLMDAIVESSMRESSAGSVITGWVDCKAENEFEVELSILNK